MTRNDIPQSRDRNGHPGRLYLQNYNLFTVHLFHAMTLGQSMGDLKVSVSKGRTVATFLDAEFPLLHCDGGRPDKQILFKTIAYVQAKIAVRNVHDSEGRPVRASQDFSRLPRGRLQDSLFHERQHPAFQLTPGVAGGTLPALRGGVGFQGSQWTPRPFKFRGSIEPPPPAPRSNDGRGDGDVRPLQEPSQPGRRRGLPGRAVSAIFIQH